MGGDPHKEPPFFFTKPADAIVASGVDVPYPPRSANLHHEVELVVAIGSAGAAIGSGNALNHVFGYAIGNDLTRRDLQADAKSTGRPWDMAKGFDHSACISAIRTVSEIGHPSHGRIWLSVNGTIRQNDDISSLIWSVSDVIAELSTLVRLQPGDLIYTGTPAGVGALARGDRIEAGIDGIGLLSNRII
jgi:fumarylpyruvate hydrolase